MSETEKDNAGELADGSKKSGKVKKKTTRKKPAPRKSSSSKKSAKEKSTSGFDSTADDKPIDDKPTGDRLLVEKLLVEKPLVEKPLVEKPTGGLGAGTDQIESPSISSYNDGFDKIAETLASIESVSEEEPIEFLVFRLGTEGYAFRVDDVDEILRHQRITIVPRAGKHLMGITSLRGRVIPIVHLGLLMNLEDRVETSSDGRILLLSEGDLVVGALVEKKINILALSPDRLLEPPPHMSDKGLEYLEGVLSVGGEFIAVLRPDIITRTKATGRPDEREA